MVCDMVCCEHCLSEFAIESTYGNVYHTVCPFCKQWTLVRWEEKDDEIEG